METSAVSVALEIVFDILRQEAKFYLGIRCNIEAIGLELQRMHAFLIDAKYPHADDRQRTRAYQIRELAYDIEDNLVKFRAATTPPISRNPITKITYFFTKPLATYTIGRNIADLKQHISELATSLTNTRSDRIVPPPARSLTAIARDLRRTYSHQVEEDFVGLEKVIEDWAADLVNEKEHHTIPIYGMGGLGKTTIARKLYIHRDVRRHFVSFAWTCVSQKLDKRDVLEGILLKLIPEEREAILKMKDDELVKKLYEVQRNKKCLVVLDDVWNLEDWQCLAPAFPCSWKIGASKLLLTTRRKDVAQVVNPYAYAMYNPRCLTKEESWELLKKKAFPRTDDDDDAASVVRIDPDKEPLGKEMVLQCDGLPLAILVLGGLLITKPTQMDWETVKQNIDRYLARGGGPGQKAVNPVLAISYHDLPYQLKQCFLYLANFPKNFDIDAEKLYQSWLADGIIWQAERDEDKTMMDAAETYLDELAQRCMVQVNVKETAGGFKSCRLHNLMRELCITTAKAENFTKVIHFRDEDNPSEMQPPMTTTRRVSFYLGRNSNFTCSDPSHIRSAFFYANDCEGDFLKRLKSRLRRFRLLRVLQLQGFKDTGELPKAIGDLIHLRYLSLWKSEYEKLPFSLAKLIHLETLDLQVATSLEIPNILWKMKQLKHLYLPKKFETHNRKKLRLDGLSDLEMLVNFNPSLCNVKDLDKLTKLRKLRALIINDKLEDLPGIINYISSTQNHLKRSYLFISCTQFSSDVEMSKHQQNQLPELLGCRRLYKLSISGHIAELPRHHHFSETIAKIEFKKSKLVEDPMAILEKLPKLSGLTLSNSAYMGEKMTCSEDGFPQLLTLKLKDLPNLRTWTIEEGAMPKLTRLVIARCHVLETVPEGLKFLKALKRLNLRWMLDGFKNGLRHGQDKEGKDFYKVSHVAEIKVD